MDDQPNVNEPAAPNPYALPFPARTLPAQQIQREEQQQPQERRFAGCRLVTGDDGVCRVVLHEPMAPIPGSLNLIPNADFGGQWFRAPGGGMETARPGTNATPQGLAGATSQQEGGMGGQRYGMGGGQTGNALQLIEGGSARTEATTQHGTGLGKRKRGSDTRRAPRPTKAQQNVMMQQRHFTNVEMARARRTRAITTTDFQAAQTLRHLASHLAQDLRLLLGYSPIEPVQWNPLFSGPCAAIADGTFIYSIGSAGYVFGEGTRTGISAFIIGVGHFNRVPGIWVRPNLTEIARRGMPPAEPKVITFMPDAHGLEAQRASMFGGRYPRVRILGTDVRDGNGFAVQPPQPQPGFKAGGLPVRPPQVQHGMNGARNSTACNAQADEAPAQAGNRAPPSELPRPQAQQTPTELMGLNAHSRGDRTILASADATLLSNNVVPPAQLRASNTNTLPAGGGNQNNRAHPTNNTHPTTTRNNQATNTPAHRPGPAPTNPHDYRVDHSKVLLDPLDPHTGHPLAPPMEGGAFLGSGYRVLPAGCVRACVKATGQVFLLTAIRDGWALRAEDAGVRGDVELVEGP